MARMIWALAVCGMAAVAMPVTAQEGNSFATPVPPAPYDASGARAPSPAKETPQAESESPQNTVTGSVPAEVAPTPLASPVTPAPQNAPVAQLSPPKEKPQAEGKASESLPVESAPQDGARAEGKPLENAQGRFTFSRVNEGYVRLDNRTGQVSFCGKRTVGWTCQLAPEDRGVLENEITRLQEENASLKKELLTHGMPLPGSMKGEPPAARNERTFSLPSDPNVDRMKVIVEKAWRRLVDMISALQKDVLKKS